MTVGEKLEQIGQNVSRVFSAGRTLGENTERALCGAKHHVTVAEGDGTTKLQFSMPFEPDVLTVWGADPRLYKKANRVAYFSADLASFSYLVAVFGAYNAGGAITTTAMTADSVLTRYSRDADGTVTLQNIKQNAAAAENYFGAGIPYIACGIVYTDQTYRERITAMVEGLDDAGGTVTFSKTKVEAAFTGEQWEALIAGKANWTFTLI